MTLTVAHWIYAGVTLAIIGTMLFRRGVVLPAPPRDLPRSES